MIRKLKCFNYFVFTRSVQYMQNSDIFCLQETKESFSIPNYRCYNKNRQNSNSGGVCIGVHRSVEKLASEVKIDSEDLIAIRMKNVMKSPMKNLVIVNVYDSPPNSSYKKRKRNDQTLEDLFEFLTTLNNDDEALIVGDFNARTGDLNHECFPAIENWNNDRLASKISGTKKVSRVSMDKVLNARGKKLLDIIASANFTIFNGITLGDVNGRHTCHLYNDSSVVDYMISTDSIKHRTANFIVSDLNNFSDHCPLYLKLDCSLPTNKLQIAQNYDNVPKRLKRNAICDPERFKLAQENEGIKGEIEKICRLRCQNSDDVYCCNEMLVKLYQNLARDLLASCK